VNSLKTLGLIIALVVTSSAFADTTQVKKQQTKKHHSKSKKVTKTTKSNSKKNVKKSDTNETAKLSTDINFNDSMVHGRYQTPDDATAKVENEKGLSDLLAVRTQFKDRLKKSSEQN
jgi:hypothetical protein